MSEQKQGKAVDHELKSFESRLTSMFLNLVEKNGFEIMNYAVETLRNMTIDMDNEKPVEHANPTDTEKAFGSVKKLPAKSNPSSEKRLMDNIKITVTSHRLEFSVPPQAVVSAMEEILDCVACAAQHVWNKIKDFFSWLWQKLSMLLCSKSHASTA